MISPLLHAKMLVFIYYIYLKGIKKKENAVYI
jgi:hypothetical protein